MKQFVILGVVLLVSWVGAFAIAVAVVEWRSVEATVFDCWEKAHDDYLRNDQDAPDSPPRSASEAAWDEYSNDFAAMKAHNELNEEHYNEQVRDCFP